MKNNILVNDELEWDKFYKNSNLENLIFPEEVTDFNRLICYTNNFFLIAGYGAFNKGYSLIIPKNIISSFAHLDNNLIEEFNWLKELIIKCLKDLYPERNVAIFEHGLCGCMGGLDRAHLHFMPYRKNNKNNIINAINYSLKRRGVGNRVVKFADYELTQHDDIDFFLKKVKEGNSNKKEQFTLTGKQFNFMDIKSDFKISDYPSGLSKKVLDNNPYIYFNSKIDESSFITFINIETQFGREIVFNIDYSSDQNLQNFLKDNNITARSDKFYWRWQDYKFENNILMTIKEMGTYLNNLKKNIDCEKFNFNSF